MILHCSRVASLVAVGSALGLAAPLLASSTPAYATGIPVSYSAYHAGYRVDFNDGSGPITTSARFQVPALACTMGKTSDGFGVQATPASATVGEACVSQRHHLGFKAVYTANILVNGVNTVLGTTVNPSDLVTVSASATGTLTSATFTDNTTGFTQTLTGPGTITEWAEVGAIADQRLPAPKAPTFATFSFTNAQVDGADIGTYPGNTFELVQTRNGTKPPRGHVEIQPGALGTSSFSLSWVS
jgi:hypothetical protein